jgi:hypothetical protein
MSTERANAAGVAFTLPSCALTGFVATTRETEAVVWKPRDERSNERRRDWTASIVEDEEKDETRPPIPAPDPLLPSPNGMRVI